MEKNECKNGLPRICRLQMSEFIAVIHHQTRLLQRLDNSTLLRQLISGLGHTSGEEVVSGSPTPGSMPRKYLAHAVCPVSEARVFYEPRVLEDGDYPGPLRDVCPGHDQTAGLKQASKTEAVSLLRQELLNNMCQQQTPR